MNFYQAISVLHGQNMLLPEFSHKFVMYSRTHCAPIMRTREHIIRVYAPGIEGGQLQQPAVARKALATHGASPFGGGGIALRALVLVGVNVMYVL